MTEFTLEELIKLIDALVRMGPPVEPFERNDWNKRRIGVGETITVDFLNQIYTAQKGEYPPNLITINSEVIPNEYNKRSKGAMKAAKYIWVIDNNGLRMMLDSVPNPQATERNEANVCHTNITGGKKALQGGELWFDENGTVYINNLSGRYGAINEQQERAVFDYFSLYYPKVVQLP